jgi:putative peptidoglycan lipid II flippase
MRWPGKARTESCARVRPELMTGKQAGPDALTVEAAQDRRVPLVMALVGAATVGVNLMFAARDLTLAHRFGAGSVLDAFLVAYIIPSYGITVLASSLPAAVVPAYIELRRRRGDQAARELLASFSGALLLVVAVLTAALLPVAPAVARLLGSSFDPATAELAARLLRLLLPILLLASLTTLWGGVLSARDRYWQVALGPMLPPLSGLVAIRFATGEHAITVLALATVTGFCVQCALLAYSLNRDRALAWPRLRRPPAELRPLVRQYASLLLYAGLMCSSTAITQAVAASLGRGALTVYAFGIKITAFPVATFATTVTITILPLFSRLVASGDWERVRRTWLNYCAAIFGLAALATIAFMLAARSIADWLLVRGEFAAHDGLQVARVQSILILQLPLHLVCLISGRLLNALKRNELLIAIGAINVTVLLLVSVFLARRYGLLGLSWSMTIVYAVSMILMFSALSYQLKRKAAGA